MILVRLPPSNPTPFSYPRFSVTQWRAPVRSLHSFFMFQFLLKAFHWPTRSYFFLYLSALDKGFLPKYWFALAIKKKILSFSHFFPLLFCIREACHTPSVNTFPTKTWQWYYRNRERNFKKKKKRLSSDLPTPLSITSKQATPLVVTKKHWTPKCTIKPVIIDAHVLIFHKVSSPTRQEF